MQRMHPVDHPSTPDETRRHDRRAFLAAVAAGGASLLLGACGATPSARHDLPGPLWPTGAPRPSRPDLEPIEHHAGAPPIQPRRSWTVAAPVTALMTPMLPVSHVTVHHTAGPTFTEVDAAATAVRIEGIRRYHRDTLGWGDIGYHFAVDRAGRVWECRSLRWQGAHVKDHNEHNIGVVCLGNFDAQDPSPEQLDALVRHVGALLRRYGVSLARLRTHQEWAPTACPGRSLQRWMEGARSAGRFV